MQQSVRLGAGALLVGNLYWAVFLARRIRQLEASEQAVFNPRLATLFRGIALSSCAAQAVAVSGLARELASWLFLYGLICCLGYAAMGFVRLLFIRPGSESGSA